MTDRELLELAAKACGRELSYAAQRLSEHRGVAIHRWNPLTDAGDRARMCDKLGISTLYGEFSFCAHTEHHEACEKYSDHNNDRTLAANRAAVRVAAEIGRAMPNA